MCKFDGCETRAIYNFQGEKPRFCNIHKIEGMVNVNSRRCGKEKCFTPFLI